jgi:hypothetical protein
MMKSALYCLVFAEVLLHIWLWKASFASFEAAVWGVSMQILYFRLVSDFPKIEYGSRFFSCIFGEERQTYPQNLVIATDVALQLEPSFTSFCGYFIYFENTASPNAETKPGNASMQNHLITPLHSAWTIPLGSR